MKKLINDRKSRLHVYLIRPLVILLCWSLAIAPVSANVAYEIVADDGGGGGGGGGSIYPVTEEEAQDALSQIQVKQNAYFTAHGKYFVSDSISQINNALGVSFSEAYWDIKAGDSSDLVGQVNSKASDLGYRIKKTGQPYCFMGEEVTQPLLKVAGSAGSLMADTDLTTGGEVHSSPVMVNLDGDADGELIVGSNDGRIYAWKHDGVSWAEFIPGSGGVFAETDGTPIRSTPAVEDIDNDGIQEVGVGTLNGNVYVFKAQDIAPVDNRADLLFQKLLGSGENIENSIVLENIDADSYDEVIALTSFGTLGIWNHDGSNYASVPPNPMGIVYGTPAVADLDNNGDKEIVIGRVSSIYAWNHDGTGFRNANGSFSTVTGEIHSSPALADIDGDGFLEILAASWSGTTGYLYAFNHDATAVEPLPPGTASTWPKNLGSNIKSSPSVADMANHSNAGYPQYNQDLEVTVGSTNGKVHAYHHDGTVVTGWPIATNRNMGAIAYDNDSSAAIVDIDDDGDKEVVIGSWGGKLYAYHHDGTTVTGWPKPADPDVMGAIELSAPSIGVLAGAPYLDVAIGSVDGTIYLWELNGQTGAGRLPWPQFRHDLKNTGAYLRPDRGIPTLSATPTGPFSVEAGNPVNFTVQGTDTGVAPLDITDISAYNLPSGASFNFNNTLNNGTFSWTPSSTGSYTVTFIATDTYGLHSVKLNIGITVTTPTIQPPVLSGIEVGVLGYTENQAPTPITNTIIVTDPDSANLVSGEVRITSNYTSNQDRLAFTNASGITGTWYLATGTMSLNGSSSVANYQAALRSVTYENISNNPSTAQRTVSFKVNDGTSDSNTLTRNISITAVNDPPTVNQDSYSTNEDVTRTVSAPGVLNNDSDPEGSPITADRTGATGPNHGTLTAFGSDGSFTYVPDPDWSGLETFTYRAYDGTLYSDYANVLITVSPVPDAPNAVDDIAGTGEDQAVDIYVLVNDYDRDGDDFAINSFTQPAHGTVTRNGDILRYTPVSNYDQTDSFTYNIIDTTSRVSNNATVSITVNPSPDNPVAVNDTATTNEDTYIDVAVMANDYDLDTGDTITLNNVVTGPSHGTAAINGTNIRYTPAANYNGSDSFTYNIRDNTSRISNTATVSMTVNSVPDNPIAVNDAAATPQGVVVDVAVMTNDYDPDTGDTITINSVVAQPAHGTAAINGNNIRYAPEASYVGPTDSFTYNIRDNTSRISNTATVTVTISAETAPVASNDTYAASEDTTLNIAAPGVLSNDTDDDPITAVLSATVSHGTLTLNSNGSFSYTPSANWFGADTFTYRAYDGILYSNTAIVTINVAQRCDDAPTAANNSYSTNEDVVLNITAPGVLGNDTNNESGTTLTAVLVTTVSQGSLTLNSNGSFVYTPPANWFGSTNFVYRARSSGGACGTPIDSANATVTITVNQLCDDAPTGVADSYSTNEGTALSPAAPGVLSNDVNNESGTTLSAVLVSTVGQGSLTLNANGSFTYTPSANWFGTTSFIYRARSSGGVCTTPIDSSNVTVTITVNQLCDDAPTAVADPYSVAQNSTLTVSSPGVLNNDTNNESGTTMTAVLSTTVSHGSLTLNANGSFTYTPTVGYTGGDSFVYRARSTSGICGTSSLYSANTTVSLTVTPNPAPVAVNDSYSTNEDTTLNVAAPGVLSNDTDADPITAVLSATVSHGSLTLNSNGSFSYTPAANWFGADTFTYRAYDGISYSNTATVTINVNQRCDDAPTGVAESYAINEDTTLTLAAPGVLSNDTNNESGTTLTAVLVTTVSHGSLTLNSNGSFTYTPTANYSGPDSFVYRPRSSGGVCTTAIDGANTTVSITVNQVCDDAPTGVADSYAASEDMVFSTLSPGVLSNDTNRESGTTLTAVLVTTVSHGSLTLNSNGSFTYTPTANYIGPDSFVYRPRSSGGVCTTAIDGANTTVSITVNQRCDDAPTGVADSYSTNEDTTLTRSAPGVLSNDTNNESGTTLTAVLVTTVSHGSLALNSNGSFTYTPTANYSGPDSFVYRPRSSGGVCTTAIDGANTTVSITVNPICDNPVANNDTYTGVMINTPYTVAAPGVLGNDTTVDPGATLTAYKLTDPSHGTVTLNTNGSLTYTPAAGYVGSDSFTYRARSNCNNLYSSAATVTFTVSSCTPPTSNPDTYYGGEDQTMLVVAPDVLENDTDPYGQPLSAVLVTNVSHGSLAFNTTDGSFTYIPAANWYGEDSFTYRAVSTCGSGTPGNIALVRLIISQRCDDPPVAVNDSYTATQNSALTVTFSNGVAINDLNPEAPTWSFGSVQKMSDPSHGTVSLAANGGFTYTPTVGYIGADSFTYRVSNSCITPLWSNTATVNINVTGCTNPVKVYNASGTCVACYDHIQDAINYASLDNNFRITAAPGIYNERLTFNRNKILTVESTSGNAADTIISGQSLGTVVNFMPATAAVTFRGFGVTYGLTSGNGGGIVVNNAPVNIQNCDINDNNANGATSKGGGIYINSDKATTISGTDILRNRATDTLSHAVYVSGTGAASFVGTNVIRHSTSSSGGCLLPGTKIAMADGTFKAIEKVLTGEKVLSVTPEGKTVASEVTQTFPHPMMKGYFVIETEDGKALNVTAIHPIYNGKEYVEASTLKVGDEIMISDNSRLALKKITKIEERDSIVDVYNLEVEPNHTYIADDVVVHNKNPYRMVNEANPPGGGN